MSGSAEHAGRRARVCRDLAAAGLDACVVLAPETQLWLCGLDSFISGVLPQALVLAEDDEPTLVVWDADLPLARDTSTIEDIRGYRFGVDDPAAAFAAARCWPRLAWSSRRSSSSFCAAPGATPKLGCRPPESTPARARRSAGSRPRSSTRCAAPAQTTRRSRPS